MAEKGSPLTRAKFGIPLYQCNLGGHELVGHLSSLSSNFRRVKNAIFGNLKEMVYNVVCTSAIHQDKKRA